MRLLRPLSVAAAGIALSLLPIAAQAQISLAITIGTPPPALPVYAVPAPPAPNYIWEPGYWAYGPGGYYWVPGTWVLAPAPNLYWTPGYWSWNGYGYVWNDGYWAPQVGYYGGINYGGGYFGDGYVGCRWVNNVVVYNTYVYRNINPRIVHERVYRSTYVVVNSEHIAYVGGNGGLRTHPTVAQMAIAHGHHWAPTSAQVSHARMYAHTSSHVNARPVPPQHAYRAQPQYHAMQHGGNGHHEGGREH